MWRPHLYQLIVSKLRQVRNFRDAAPDVRSWLPPQPRPRLSAIGLTAGIVRHSLPTGLFIQTLNEITDNQGKRLAALRKRVPNIVLLALFGVAAIASKFAGYASGFEDRRTRLPVFIMGSWSQASYF